jgi:hypothetical protein
MQAVVVAAVLDSIAVEGVAEVVVVVAGLVVVGAGLVEVEEVGAAEAAFPVLEKVIGSVRVVEICALLDDLSVIVVSIRSLNLQVLLDLHLPLEEAVEAAVDSLGEMGTGIVQGNIYKCIHLYGISF